MTAQKSSKGKRIILLEIMEWDAGVSSPIATCPFNLPPSDAETKPKGKKGGPLCEPKQDKGRRQRKRK